MFRRRNKGRAREDEVAILVAGPSSSGDAVANTSKNKRRYKMFGGKNKGHANSNSATSTNYSTGARKPNPNSSTSALGLELEHSPMQLETKPANASSSSAQLPPAIHSTSASIAITSTDKLNRNNATPLTSPAGNARNRKSSGGGRGQKSSFNVQQPPSDTSDADRLSGRTPSQRDSTSEQPIMDIPPSMAGCAIEANVGFNDGSAAAILDKDSFLPLQRTGWSNVSAASSAANSEQYIQKLDNLPAINSSTSANGTTKVRNLKSPC